MSYQDISLQWTIQNPHLKNMSMPISQEEFGLEKMERSLSSQFKILSFMTQTQHHLQKLYQNPQQFPLNRNSHIMTFDPTRVIIGPEQAKQKSQNYINANFIQVCGKKAIATQGPLTTSFYNLYRMIEKYGITKIFMLCSLIEKNKIKCDRYWPNQETEGGKLFQKQYQITLISQQKQDGLRIRQLEIKNVQNDFQIVVTHYQLINWPDGDCPLKKSKKKINFLLQEFLQSVSQEKHPIVHCSAGVGRTGTFIAMAILKKMIENKEQISVFDSVRKLREQRWAMVYTCSQYQYLYDYAQDQIIAKKNKQNGIDSSDDSSSD